MPDVLEDGFKKTLSNIKEFTIKPNNEDTSVSEIEKYLIEAIFENSTKENVQYKNESDEKIDSYFLEQIRSRLKCDVKNDVTDNQKCNRLIPESGIRTDDGLSHFPNEMEEYQLQPAKANNLSKRLKCFAKPNYFGRFDEM
ncbi:hypothetical protein [Candidatus Mesenet endosymbiont of Agriotes lineatus]|uniref:hypothetical protein n=1 Tax=Candidatus Mesenet endosymbiont of Agriotes lineatus TaxID=3077948 RepID=UPI0030CB692D